jgi:adenosine deaminase CECR1
MVTVGFLSFESAYRENIRRLLWAFAQDGVQYAEIRVALNSNFNITSDDGEKLLGVPEVLQLFVDVMKEELPKIRDQGFDFYGIKVIYACRRNDTNEAMRWCMDTCIAMKQRYPDLICGK